MRASLGLKALSDPIYMESDGCGPSSVPCVLCFPTLPSAAGSHGRWRPWTCRVPRDHAKSFLTWSLLLLSLTLSSEG